MLVTGSGVSRSGVCRYGGIVGVGALAAFFGILNVFLVSALICSFSCGDRDLEIFLCEILDDWFPGGVLERGSLVGVLEFVSRGDLARRRPSELKLASGFCFLLTVGLSARCLSSGELDRECCGELTSSSLSSGLRGRGILSRPFGARSRCVRGLGRCPPLLM